jgi:WD40 repeat protein
MVKVVKGLPAEWGGCCYTILLNSIPWSLSYHDNTIAVGTFHGDITILNALTGSWIATLSGHTAGVGSLTFLSDGTSLMSASLDCTVKFWDVQTGGIIKTFYHSHGVQSASISADYTRIATRFSDKTINLWDIQTGECYHTMKQQSNVFDVCFSPTDPQHLFSTSDNKVWQWDTNGYQIKPPFNGDSITFSPNGAWFVSCYEGVATVQNSDSRAIVSKFCIANGSAKHCCFSPDGRLMAGAAGSTAYVWNITNPDPHLIQTFVGHIQGISSLAFSSPSSLISASYDGSVKLWQIGAPSTDPVLTDLNPTPITSAQIQDIALQAKDGITITSDSDGMVKAWDITTGLCKASYQTPAKDTDYRDVQLIDGRLICVWYTGDGIEMWDTEKGELWTVDYGLSCIVVDLKISGDGSKVFILEHKSIQVCSIQTGELISKLEVKGRLTQGSLIVDGSRIWAHSLNLEYEGWDFGVPGPSPVQLNNIPPHRLHPSGAILWDLSLSRIKDQTTGKVVFQLSRRFPKAVDAQWNGQYLLVYYPVSGVLVLDFSYLLL